MALVCSRIGSLGGLRGVWTIQSRGWKQNTCYLPVCDAKIVIPKMDSCEVNKVGAFLQQHYIPYEPIARANEVKVRNSLMQYYKNAAGEGNVVYAVADDEVLGMAVCSILDIHSAEYLMKYCNKIKDYSVKRYLSFWVQLEEKMGIYRKLNTKTELNVEALAVHTDFRRRQVANMLVNGLIQLAEERNQKVVRVNTANLYCQKLVRRAGYQIMYQGPSNTFKDDDGKPYQPAELCVPHKELQVLAMDLKTRRQPPAEEKDPCKVLTKYDS